MDDEIEDTIGELIARATAWSHACDDYEASLLDPDSQECELAFQAQLKTQESLLALVRKCRGVRNG